MSFCKCSRNATHKEEEISDGKKHRDRERRERERESESASAGLRAVVLRSCASKELLMR